MGDDLLRQAIAAMSPERQEAIRRRSLELLRSWGTVELTEPIPDAVPAQVSQEAGSASPVNGHTIDPSDQKPAPQAGDNEALAALVRAVQEAIAARQLMETTPGAPHLRAGVAKASSLG
ncbi:hypothetical protein ACFQU1_23765 [Chelatococcus sp. GCM10030263]|uniref:hypothetical protein n=1 Tax=Chelatococcus sp. GCM10030263 TaxID=3273387 RepID=UPI003620C141